MPISAPGMAGFLSCGRYSGGVALTKDNLWNGETSLEDAKLSKEQQRRNRREAWKSASSSRVPGGRTFAALTGILAQ